MENIFKPEIKLQLDRLLNLMPNGMIKKTRGNKTDMVNPESNLSSQT